MIIQYSRYPTSEEIDAIVRAARRERAAEIARLLSGAARGLGGLIARSAQAMADTRARRRATPPDSTPAKERFVAESFWKTAAASLPPRVQERYARLFEAAEEYEPVIEFVVTARGRGYRALARTCRGLADALRNAARALDAAAWRLTLTR